MLVSLIAKKYFYTFQFPLIMVNNSIASKIKTFQQLYLSYNFLIYYFLELESQQLGTINRFYLTIFLPFTYYIFMNLVRVNYSIIKKYFIKNYRIIKTIKLLKAKLLNCMDQHKILLSLYFKKKKVFYIIH